MLREACLPNPATLLPAPPSDVQRGHSVAPGHSRNIVPDVEQCIYFTDGSSFIQRGTRDAGAVMMGLGSGIWATALPPGTSAQKAELKALAWASKLAKGAIANIHSDSRWD